MELRHLRYFAMAAEERNISRAAARLFVSQPAVSRQIKDLEEELGVKLFRRKPDGLRLTDAGHTALAHTREILRQAHALTEAMERWAQRDASAVIKVGFLPTALPKFLTESLRRFHRRHPGIQVHIFEMMPRAQEEALCRGEIDLALLGDPSAGVRREFEVAPIFRTPMAMIVPDDHPLARRKAVRLDEFASDTFVSLHEDQFPERPRLTAELFAKARIGPAVTLRARGLSELLGLVGSGAGVALAPADLANMPHGGVAFLPLKHPRRTLVFSAAWRKDDRRPELESLLGVIRNQTTTD